MEKKLIILFYPEVSDRFYSIPYAFLYLERVVRDLEVEVLILDERHTENIEKIISENQHRLILAGVSAMIGNQILSGKSFSQKIKALTNIPVVWGGWFVTELPELSLQEDFIDFIIIGQGEKPFRMLVEHMLGQDTKIEEIKGLGYKNNGNIIINQMNQWEDTYKYPKIDFDKIDVGKYLENDGKTLHYIASQGCPCRCNFCIMYLCGNQKNIHPPVEDVIDDLKNLILKHPQINFVKFNDDNLLANKNYTLSLCKRFLEEDFSFHWAASTHIRLFNKLYNDDDIRLLKKAGCVLIYSGAESGDNEILQKLNKELTAKEIIENIKVLTRHGIHCSYSFMVCFPENPGKDLSKTLKLLLHAYLINPKFKLSLSYYLPLPDNEFRTKAIEKGFLVPRTFAEYEKAILTGFEFPWIDQKMKNTINKFLLFFMPAVDTDFRNTIYAGKTICSNLIFFLYKPIMYFRLIFRIYKYSFEVDFFLLDICQMRHSSAGKNGKKFYYARNSCNRLLRII